MSSYYDITNSELYRINFKNTYTFTDLNETMKYYMHIAKIYSFILSTLLVFKFFIYAKKILCAKNMGSNILYSTAITYSNENKFKKYEAYIVDELIKKSKHLYSNYYLLTAYYIIVSYFCIYYNLLYASLLVNTYVLILISNKIKLNLFSLLIINTMYVFCDKIPYIPDSYLYKMLYFIILIIVNLFVVLKIEEMKFNIIYIYNIIAIIILFFYITSNSSNVELFFVNQIIFLNFEIKKYKERHYCPVNCLTNSSETL